MEDSKKSFVFIIAGPPGTGKTTLSKMLIGHYNCDHISEDELTKELFPDTYVNIEDYPDKLKIVARTREKINFLKKTGEIAKPFRSWSG